MTRNNICCISKEVPIMIKIDQLPEEVVLLREKTIVINFLSDILSDERNLRSDLRYLLKIYYHLIMSSWYLKEQVLEIRREDFTKECLREILQISLDAFNSRKRYKEVVKKVKDYELSEATELTALERTLTFSKTYLVLTEKIEPEVRLLLAEVNQAISFRIKDQAKAARAHSGSLLSAKQMVRVLNEALIIKSI